ncbi:tetratricopeptide repeat protein [Allochromatium palmeri]|uniref:Uncharacterized protein n=1 Tax=Allochromatium palmeri TaxID=231048 RepID=A0A6N8EAM5_9GAMM|nr:tetratricopeptide repeat protein [Allochromatium palmeri]MTW21205.1 hypothetical protein [Allochromatium palmeri]
MLAGILTIATNQSYGDGMVSTMADVVRLPKYCWGTQLIRNITNDPVPISKYVEIYGKSYMHLHHFCWGLDFEYRAMRSLNQVERNFRLSQALGNIDYVLTYNRDPHFVFLPEIYTARARILFMQQENSEAVRALQQAIALKPSYVPAVSRLSGYYKFAGDNAKAMQVLKEGLLHSPNSSLLKKRFAALSSGADAQTPTASKPD